MWKNTSQVRIMYDLERIARAIADIERYFVDMESLEY